MPLSLGGGGGNGGGGPTRGPPSPAPSQALETHAAAQRHVRPAAHALWCSRAATHGPLATTHTEQGKTIQRGGDSDMRAHKAHACAHLRGAAASPGYGVGGWAVTAASRRAKASAATSPKQPGPLSHRVDGGSRGLRLRRRR